MASHIEINDPIHKRIVLTAREKDIIDHRYVQRLRHIRQLGFVSWVYPSATHDRFSHALGTLHVANLLAEALFEREDVSAFARTLSASEKSFLKSTIRLAGLLHDIGHAPFSHAAERIMPPIEKLAIPASWRAKSGEKRIATHEDYTALLLAGMSEGEARILEKDEAHILASLVHHSAIEIPHAWTSRFSHQKKAESIHAVARSLISSDIDADRMDYLLRDSHFAGVVYGEVDIPWLISNLGTVEKNGTYIMSISEAGIHALEHYLFARYHMYVQVYMHKTVKCFEHYFTKAIEERETEYRIPTDREEYAGLRDSTIIENIFSRAALKPNSWSGRLVRREPAKRIARIWGNEDEARALLGKLERALKPAGAKPFLVVSKRKFLNLPSAKTNTDTSQGLFQFGLSTLPLAVIRKQFGRTSVAPLGDYSFTLKKYHEDISISDIYILPDEYQKNEKEILDIIKKFRTFAEPELELSDPEND